MIPVLFSAIWDPDGFFVELNQLRGAPAGTESAPQGTATAPPGTTPAR
jgi:hypothetical protein